MSDVRGEKGAGLLGWFGVALVLLAATAVTFAAVSANNPKERRLEDFYDGQPIGYC